MSAAPTPVTNVAPRRRRHRLRDFWARVTEGAELGQLGRQVISDAKATYGLYSKDVDWDEIGSRSRGLRRVWRSAWAVFQAMLMKLTPARRVLLLLAIVLLVVQPDFRYGKAEASIQLGGVGVAILFVLLAMELADKVTMKRDLEIAREIQQSLVPEHPPSVAGLDIAFAARPQNTVAGDYYDAFLRPLPAKDSTAPPLLVVVADVAGKSVPAALLMATFQASLHALAATAAALGEIAAGLERYCRAHSAEGGRFTTAFLAEVDPETREMIFVNAGHNDPILRRASGQMERLSAGGPPFGIPLFTEEPAPYPLGRVELRPRDLLVVFTDGLVEAVNDAGEEYGEARLLLFVQNVTPETSGETVKRVMADVSAFVGSARQHDDITCVILRVGA